MRLAVLPDFAEERWPSMDLCAEMLLAHLPAVPGIEASPLQPGYRRLLGRLPVVGRSRLVRNFERLRNRFRTYPRFLRPAAGKFDFFHVCDHSYAHLVNSLPPGRAGVYCHDLDAFRCLIEPAADPRPEWFRRMTAKILAGFQNAVVVFCTTETVRSQIEHANLVEPARLVVAPNGVAPEFRPEGDVHRAPGGSPYLLHVGSCIPRKRIELLTELFALARKEVPDLRLLQVGGEWTDRQRELIGKLGIASAVEQVRGLSREELARRYRGAALVVQPSAAEGFGLPVVEALACGARVLATDLPVFREVGGPAVEYVPGGDVGQWAGRVVNALRDPESLPPRAARIEQAGRFSWKRQAEIIGGTYLRLAGQL